MLSFKCSEPGPKWDQAVINWFVFPLLTLLFQGLFLLVLSVFGSLLLLEPEQLFWGWAPDQIPGGHRFLVIGMWTLGFGFLFGGVWCAYWRLAMTGIGRIPAFALHVLVAWLPLIAIVLFADPVSNPQAMIPSPKAGVTFQMSLLLLAAALFPLYAAAVYRYGLRPSAGKAVKLTRLFLIGVLFSGICLGLLPFFWRMAPILYHGIDSFPVQ